MKQLYLCGAISSNPHYKQDFEEARKRLISANQMIRVLQDTQAVFTLRIRFQAMM